MATVVMRNNQKHSGSKKLSRRRSFKLSLMIPMLCSSSNASSPSHSSSSLSGKSRLEELQQVFRHLDQDRDGKISGRELSTFFSAMGDEELRSDEIDFDAISHLDFNDFVKLMEKEEEDDLRKAFEMFEAVKGSGRITPKGLQRVLSRLGDERSVADCQAMISVYDVNGDGELDFHEFHRMMSC